PSDQPRAVTPTMMTGDATRPRSVSQVMQTAWGSSSAGQVVLDKPKPTPEKLPPPAKVQANGEAHVKRFVPVTLDAVFHLAEDQNAQVNQARAKLEETYSDKYLADKAWIPEVNVGVAYNRHEGGIQNFQGKLVHSSYGSLWAPGLDVCAKLDVRELSYQKIKAEQRVWQQESEVSRMTSDTLVEAA